MITYGEVEYGGVVYLLTSCEYANRVKRGMKLSGVQSRMAESVFGLVWTLYEGNNKIIGFEALAVMAHNKRLMMEPAKPKTTNEKTEVDVGFKIDTNVPIPSKKGRIGAFGGYPFDKMVEVNSSFFVPLKEGDFTARPGTKSTVAEKLRGRIRSYGYKYRKFMNDDFRLAIFERSKVQHKECGVRVWRIKPKSVKKGPNNES